MSIESFIHAMPKVELNLRFEGAIRKDSLLLIAQQNEVPARSKRFNDWVQLLDNPNYEQLDSLFEGIMEWVQHPEDLTRLIYDLGVYLSKQNVKYAEVTVTPVQHMLPGMAFDTFMDALNDGRDRAERGWGVRIAWILAVPRAQPRRADETLRWATSATSKKGKVAAFGLVGRDDAQPVGQFERAFNAAYKKDMPRVICAGEVLGEVGVLEALQQLYPSRIVGGRNITNSPEAMQQLVEREIPLVVSMKQAICQKWITGYEEYPLRQIIDEGVDVVLGTDMPQIYKTTLSDEYLAAVQHCDISLEELEKLCLNGILHSYMTDDEKIIMAEEFQEAYARLRAEHLDLEQP